MFFTLKWPTQCIQNLRKKKCLETFILIKTLRNHGIKRNESRYCVLTQKRVEKDPSNPPESKVFQSNWGRVCINNHMKQRIKQSFEINRTITATEVTRDKKLNFNNALEVTIQRFRFPIWSCFYEQKGSEFR